MSFRRALSAFSLCFTVFLFIICSFSVWVCPSGFCSLFVWYFHYLSVGTCLTLSPFLNLFAFQKVQEFCIDVTKDMESKTEVACTTGVLCSSNAYSKEPSSSHGFRVECTNGMDFNANVDESEEVIIEDYDDDVDQTVCSEYVYEEETYNISINVYEYQQMQMIETKEHVDTNAERYQEGSANTKYDEETIDDMLMHDADTRK